MPNFGFKLPGGKKVDVSDTPTDTEVLTFNSTKDEWDSQAPGGGTDLTTKGDLHGYDTGNNRIPIGANDEVLTADSAQALGLKWAAAAGGGTWEILDFHEAASAESTYTFTPASPLSVDDYSAIAIFIDGETTASLILQLVINGLTTGNATRGFRTTGSGIVHISLLSQAQLQLLSSVAIASSYQIQGYCYVSIIDIGSKDVAAQSWFHATNNLNQEFYSHNVGATETTYISFQIKTSTSTWKIGTKITIYGIKRA